MAVSTGLMNLRAMGGRYGVAARFDGVGCVARDAGRQIPDSLPTATSMNAGRHLLCLAAMARSADDVAIGGYLSDPVASMASDATPTGAAATQLGMSALRNVIMGLAMACAATNWPGRFGVRRF